ncbi:MULTISPECIES: glycosyltransferase family 4 protein [unclassified Methylococcus]|jgi:glycosyltransferase involved in cell wall biosynthesis|uniref:glycosyltransferase family 4 protein n=1 Tax=unclassified Methylococcus TaxID=2618889 RepID=UPI003D7D8325
MQILFLNRFFYPDHSATSQLLSDLAFALGESDRKVRVITSRQRYDDPGADLPAFEAVGGVFVHRVWTSRFGRAWLPGRALDYLSFYVSAGWRLWRLTRAGDVIVAKTDPPLISLVGAVVARLRGARLVNWLQDLFPEVAEALGVRMPGLAVRRLRDWRNASLRQARTNVVLGERMAERLRESGVPAERVEIIHNWADGGTIRPTAAAGNPLREEWGLSGRFVAAYSGNLGRAHEFDTLLAAAELLRGLDGMAFLFIGGGHGYEKLRLEASRRGLANVLFKPYQPRERLGLSLTLPDIHLISLLPALEGLVLPSKFYGVLAAGRPVAFVGARDGELSRQIERHACGASFAPGDADGLAGFLLALSRDGERRERMGRNARTAFENEFDQVHALAKWRALLTPLRPS